MSRVVRALVVTCLVFVWPASTRAQAHGDGVQLWLAPDAGALGIAVRSALVQALGARGKSVTDLVSREVVAPSFRTGVARAIEAYRALRFVEAADALRELSTEARRSGGGDLDTHELADLYLYLALASQERGATDVAWDSFVQAALIDPTRTLDPAQVPPRATAVHRRAQQELARQPGIDLEVRVPSGAMVRIDGDVGSGPGPFGRKLGPGAHFVQVELVGFQPYRGVLTLQPGVTREVFEPTLRPIAGPAMDLRDTQARAVLRRMGDGWMLSLRARSAETMVEAAAPLQAEEVGAVTTRLVDRVFGPLAAPARAGKPVWKRWWVWTTVGIAVVGIAVAVPIGIVTSRASAPGSVGGTLDPLR